VNLQYYQAQKHLLTLQGRDNLWLAGLYMHDGEDDLHRM